MCVSVQVCDATIINRSPNAGYQIHFIHTTMRKEYFLDKENEGMDRVDGRQKVMGTARYSAEYDIPKLSYGVLVESTIAKGRIRSVDAKQAERAPGVFGVLWYANAPKIPG